LDAIAGGAAKMKWEYYYTRIDIDTQSIFKYATENNWELVSVDNDIAYFKRPTHKYRLIIEKTLSEQSLEKRVRHLEFLMKTTVPTTINTIGKPLND
jgi:hypothetical protein